MIAGRYTLQEKIGEGGMGDVWVAKQTEPVKRRVALKLIKAGMDTKAVLQRFEAERQALAMMDYPNIAKVLDGGMTADRRPFFVMELVNGLPLTKFCDEAKLGIRERLELFAAICQAVQHAHQKGIIHRDLKPSNILVTLIDAKPVPKVIDFGVAKAIGGKLLDESLSTQFGAVVGTLEYMSPEQAGFSGSDIDTRADIYSLGVILYELLTGLRPIDAKRLRKAALSEMIRIIQDEEPSKPSTRLSTDEALPSLAASRHIEPKKLMALLRGELDWVVMKCLEKQRERRYETASGLARDIQRYLADEPVEARPPSAGYRLRKFVRRNKGQVVAASLVLFALLAGIAGATFGLIRANRSALAERLAKLDAQEQKASAEKAAAAERQAADKERQATAVALARLKEIEKANGLLESIFQDVNPLLEKKGGPLLIEQLTKRLLAVADKLDTEAIGDPLTVARLQNFLGNTLLSLGEHRKAIELHQQAGQTWAKLLGPDHPDTLRSMGYLADGYHSAGRLDLAVPLYEETLKLQKAKLGADHPDTLHNMNNLASCYHNAGKLELALPLYQETLKLQKAKLGADHPDTFNSMNNLAFCYQSAGKQDLAVPLYEETLRLKKANLGRDHPDTLKTMDNLAACYQSAGKLELALPLFEESLKLSKAKLGRDHPDTLKGMSNLAGCYQSAGKLDLALPLFDETLKLSKAKLGPEHPDTLRSMTNLGSAYLAAGQLDKALPLLEDTLKLKTAKLGPEHPLTLTCMNNLAYCYQSAGKLDLALPLYEETLKLHKAKLGPEHPETLTFMNNLAGAYRAGGRLPEAIALHEQAAAGIERLRFQHLNAGRIIASTTSAYEAANQLDKAEAWRRKWLAVVKDRAGADSTAHAGELAALGLNLLNQKKWTEAEPVLKECLAVREQKQPDAWSTFNTKSSLGGALLGQTKYAEAEPLLKAGYEGLKAREKTIPPQGKTRLSEALDRLIELYTAKNSPDEVTKWRAERAKYPAANAAMK